MSIRKERVTITLSNYIVKKIDYLVRAIHGNRSAVIEKLLEDALENEERTFPKYACIDCGGLITSEEAKGPRCPHCGSPFTRKIKDEDVEIITPEKE
jgi:DNA-directed RNA polymerase subunit RPC12/RpoP